MRSLYFKMKKSWLVLWSLRIYTLRTRRERVEGRKGRRCRRSGRSNIMFFPGVAGYGSVPN